MQVPQYGMPMPQPYYQPAPIPYNQGVYNQGMYQYPNPGMSYGQIEQPQPVSHKKRNLKILLILAILVIGIIIIFVYYSYSQKSEDNAPVPKPNPVPNPKPVQNPSTPPVDPNISIYSPEYGSCDDGISGLNSMGDGVSFYCSSNRLKKMSDGSAAIYYPGSNGTYYTNVCKLPKKVDWSQTWPPKCK